MLTTAFFYVGGLLLLLLSFNDYRTKVVKHPSKIAYLFGIVLFLAINLLVFISICAVALKAGPRDLALGTHSIPEGSNTAMPLLIALAYFGIGVAGISVGGSERSIYGLLRRVFQGIFAPKDSDVEEIQQAIRELSTESSKLETKIADLRTEGEKKNWNMLEFKHSEIERDRDMLREEIGDISSYLQELGGDVLSIKQVERTRRNMGRRVEKLEMLINEKLKGYLAELVYANRENQEAIERILPKLDLSPSKFLSKKETCVPFCRAIVISLVMGVFLGFFHGHFFSEEPGSFLELWRYTAAMGVFGIVVSFVVLLRKGGHQLPQALGIGLVAGASAHFVWIWMEKAGALPKLHELAPILEGATFGACVAFLLHFFRVYVASRYSSKFFLYGLISILGGGSFVLVAYLDPILDVPDIKKIAEFALIGSFAMLAASLSANIFHVTDTGVQHERP